MDIKGKSAKCGVHSGFVPFLQIHDNEHKKMVGSMRQDKRVRVFYPNMSSRDTAASILSMLGTSMCKLATLSQERVEAGEGERKQTRERTPNIRSKFLMGNLGGALKDSQRCFMTDPAIYLINEYAKTSNVYGLDIPEKLFCKFLHHAPTRECMHYNSSFAPAGEGYVVPNDITRDGEDATGRPSMPEFQQMNLDTLREGSDVAHDIHSDTDAGPRPALWHAGCGRPGEDSLKYCNPLCPKGS